MSALSDALLIFSSQFNLLFFSVSVTMPHQHCGVLLFLMRNIGHRTLPKIWVGTFLVRNIQYRENFELILSVTGRCIVSGDTSQYRLEESVFHRRTRQTIQLFTYLLTQRRTACHADIGLFTLASWLCKP